MSNYSMRVDKADAPAWEAKGWKVLKYGGSHAMVGTDDRALFEAGTAEQSAPAPAPEAPKKKAKAKKGGKA
jgi:hypothetical protein